MTDALNKKIQEELAKLPKEYKEVIESSNWVKISEEIGAKNLLEPKEINVLQGILFTVILGLSDVFEFASLIEDELNVSKKMSETLVDELVKQVIFPIQDKLIQIVKNNLPNKKTTWKQNVDFVLSGGDYLSFL